jgi:dihydropteroate synthase
MTAPLIMGILNVTPDSFSDGGRYESFDDAIAHGLALREAGAQLVDVGGESTRPGAVRVSVEEEIARVVPVVRELAAASVRVSVDTMNADTAIAAASAGASIINDVSGGLADPGMYRIVAETGLEYVAMHWRGASPADSAAWSHGHDAPEYGDVVAEVREELKARLAEMVVWGIDLRKVVLDPGIGFAKNAEHNWRLLGHLPELATLGHRLLIGVSRKRFLGALLPEGAPADERDLPTAVLSALAAESGVWAVRVHDVESTRVALATWQALDDGRNA